MCNSPSSLCTRSSSENTHFLETSGKDREGTPIDVDKELTQRLTLTAKTRELLPSDSLSISELLGLCLPTFSAVTPSVEPSLCFSNHPPTESVAIYLSRPVPPVTFIEGLRDASRQSMLDGKLSIMDWTCKNSNSFFSFELVEFWGSLTQIIRARQEWETALRSFVQVAKDEPLEKEVREVHLIIQTIPWKAGLQVLRSCLSEKNRSQLCTRDFLDIMRLCNKVDGQKVRFRLFKPSMLDLGRSYSIGTYSCVSWHRRSSSGLNN